MRRIRRSLPASIGLVTLAACGAGDRSSGTAWRAVTDTIGDTIVVRTVAGSVWGEPAELVEEMRIGVFEGEDVYMFGSVRGFAVAPDGGIFVYDAQVPALRKYAPDGTYVATFGRQGGGPGEYRRSDGGVAVLPDGRIALRDPGNARMQLYTADGEPAGSWRIPGGRFTSQRLFVDTAGYILNWVALDLDRPLEERRNGLVRHAPDGTPGDTILAPRYDYEAPRLRAERIEDESRAVGIRGVPFMPSADWTFSPLGYMVGSLSTSYRLDLFRADGVLRIAREYERVPVAAGEKTNLEERTIAGMRDIDPAWRWDGPPIPDTKPPYSAVHVGADGRIWVVLHQPAREIEVDDSGPDRPGEPPPVRYREPVVFDVFEPDGRYLGQVRAPDGFSLSPAPFFRGDRVWAIVRDELDVQYLVRFRVVRASERVVDEAAG